MRDDDGIPSAEELSADVARAWNNATPEEKKLAEESARRMLDSRPDLFSTLRGLHEAGEASIRRMGVNTGREPRLPAPATYLDVTGHASRYPSTAGLPDELLPFLPQAMIDEQRARNERIRKIQKGVA